MDNFLSFLHRTRVGLSNAHRRVLGVKLTIEKVVTLPPHEFEGWTSWYDEQKSLNVSFEKDYVKATSRPRHASELVQEEVFRFK